MDKATFENETWTAHVRDFGYVGGQPYVEVDDGTDTVCRVMVQTRRFNPLPYADRARLISAAPDLVEALDGPDPDAPECIKPLSWLHSMVAHCKARGPAPDDDDPAAFHDMIGEVEALYVRARAALSKALGEGQEDNG